MLSIKYNEVAETANNWMPHVVAHMGRSVCIGLNMLAEAQLLLTLFISPLDPQSVGKYADMPRDMGLAGWGARQLSLTIVILLCIIFCHASSGNII